MSPIVTIDEPPGTASITGAAHIQGRRTLYQFGAPVAEGKFGVVEIWWEVGDGVTSKYPVAVKFLPIHHKAVKYPIREVLWLSRFCHPHIVKFYELIRVNEHIGIVMEYLPKGSFRAFLKSQPGRRLKEKLARWYFQQLVHIVDFCHRVQGIAHRDLKPENLLVAGNRNIIKLADFGMSKHISLDSAPITRLGTKSYAAPEVTQDNPGKYDAKKADIWSCGVVLHEMVHGFSPFAGKQAQKVPAEVSAECQDLLQQMLVSDPRQRITLEHIKEHPWLTRDLKPNAFHMNDKYRAFPANAQTEEEICKILEEAFPDEEEQFSKGPGLINCFARLMGRRSSVNANKRVRIDS